MLALAIAECDLLFSASSYHFLRRHGPAPHTRIAILSQGRGTYRTGKSTGEGLAESASAAALTAEMRKKRPTPGGAGPVSRSRRTPRRTARKACPHRQSAHLRAAGRCSNFKTARSFRNLARVVRSRAQVPSVDSVD